MRETKHTRRQCIGKHGYTAEALATDVRGLAGDVGGAQCHYSVRSVRQHKGARTFLGFLSLRLAATCRQRACPRWAACALLPCGAWSMPCAFPMVFCLLYSCVCAAGVNNNAYQISRALYHNSRTGSIINDLSQFVKADFMNMPFEDNSFDAVYQIDATCHAPDQVGCYKVRSCCCSVSWS